MRSMAFFQLKSTNPKLSYIIKKNPESGMQAKTVRKGVAFGYFTKDSDLEYNVYFQDGPNEISYLEYADQEFEYINATRYSSTIFIINAISDFFRDPLKKLDEQDTEGFKHTLTINLIQMGSMRMFRAFEHHFAKTCQIEANEITRKYFQLKFTTEKSLHYLLNLVNLFCCFNTLQNISEYLHIDEGVLEKYFLSLAFVDSPYFIRYAFKAQLLRNNKWFNQYKSLLEKSERYSQIELKYGDTLQMRRTFVQEHLTYKNSIVDVGCGEGHYIGMAGKIGNKNQYYAIDIDESCRQTVRKRAKKMGLKNVHILDALDLDVMGFEIADFLLCEVIEHMPVEEAEKLVNLCLSNSRCNSIIITTPNRDFNFHYFDESKFRFPDHLFEFSEEEFKEWLKKFNAKTQVFQVGDILDGKSVSLGAVLRR